MDYNARLDELKEKMNEGKFREAADGLEDLANETGNINVVICSMIANYLDGTVLYELDDNEGAVDRMNIIIDWVIACSKNDELWKKEQSFMEKEYAKAQLLKGKALYCINKHSEYCLNPLSEAIKYGAAEANYWYGIWHVVNSPDTEDDYSGFVDAVSPGIPYLEAYLDSLTEEEIDEKSERINRTSEFLVSWYYSQTPKDMRKIEKYQAIQNVVK